MSPPETPPNVPPHHFWVPVILPSLIGVVTIAVSVLLSTWTVKKQLAENARISQAQLTQSATLLRKQLEANAETTRLQVQGNAEVAQMQIRANAETAKKQMEASLAAIDLQSRLQKEQNEYQDKVAAAHAVAQRKAQCVKELTEALADFEELADQRSDIQASGVYRETENIALQSHGKRQLEEMSWDTFQQSVSKLTYARSKLRSCLATATRLFVITNSPPLKAAMDTATARLEGVRGYKPLINKTNVDRMWEAFSRFSTNKDIGPYMSVSLDIMSSVKREILEDDDATAEQVRKILAQLQIEP